MTLKIYLIYLAFLSLAALIAYVKDKKKARDGAWRIPEATLLALSFLGGAIGGYLAMQLVRHKTKKRYFHFVNLIGVLWQTILLIYLIQNPNILF